MNHWPVVPVILPLIAGALLLLPASLELKRRLACVATAALVPIALGLLVGAQEGTLTVYAFGAWPPPFGITFVVDRLAAVMVLLTAVVALPSLLYATAGEDDEGRYFHALFQFQLAGLNGAFLTGDVFNLFVFFEILLIASYALLLHGQGVARSRAALHLVSINLVGSTLFLFAVAALYGSTGTLNMADLARVVPQLGPESAGVARAGALLLLVVLGLKAALLPLSFWLPQSYSSAAASVAALFAIMTKVGAYVIMRLYTLVFGADAGLLANVAEPWVLPLALATFVFAVAGMFAAATLRAMVSWLVIASVGMLLSAVGLFSEDGFTAGVYYIAHSTLATAALFLIADLVRRQRLGSGDRLHSGEAVHQPALLGSLFFVTAVIVVGLPPSSGFIGKILILNAALAQQLAPPVWGILLAGTLIILVGLARAGSIVFWKTDRQAPALAVAAAGPSAPLRCTVAVVWLIGATALMVAFGAPATDYARATARQLFDTAAYREAVLGDSGLAGRVADRPLGAAAVREGHAP